MTECVIVAYNQGKALVTERKKEDLADLDDWRKDLPYFPSLAPLPYRPKRFHLGTEGDHHAFLGLLAFLPLLRCLASFPCLPSFPYRPKTFSFRYRIMISNFVNIGFQGTNTPHNQKRFHLSIDRQSCLPWFVCLPSLDFFPCFLPLYRQNVFIQVQK